MELGDFMLIMLGCPLCPGVVMRYAVCVLFVRPDGRRTLHSDAFGNAFQLYLKKKHIFPFFPSFCSQATYYKRPHTAGNQYYRLLRTGE